MKITDVKAVFPKYRHVVPSWRTHFWQIMVRVETDAGVAGLGYGGGGTASVGVVNRHFRELLLGRQVSDVEDIVRIWDCLYAESLPYGRKGLAIMALSGVDLALYNLLGKAEGVPRLPTAGRAAQGARAGLCHRPGFEVVSPTGLPGPQIPPPLDWAGIRL